MSAITSNTSSLTGAGYATQLAQSATIKRTLASLGTAIQNGDLVPANNILAAFFKANPQYVTDTTADSDSQPQNPLNSDFQTLETALSNNQVSAAQTAWTQVKTDLANQGVNLDNVNTSTSQVVSQATDSMDNEVLTDMFGTSSSGSSSLATLLGGGTSDSSSTSSTGVSSSLIGQWLTYQQSGTNTATVAPATSINPSSVLNIAA